MPVHNHFRVNETDRSFQGKEKETPNYNWGYDPHSYFSLEGWYSTNAKDPYKRINEFRSLVDKLHAANIGVIVDVVYNHTFQYTILNDLAPGIYHRKRGGSMPVGDPAVESRSPMVRKLIIDSLKHMVDYYGVDGFRFDLMGFMDVETMKAIRKELGDDIVLHGEAWNFTDLPLSEAPIKGIYDSYPHGINLGVFNDTSRDAYAGRNAEPGFIQGILHENPKTKSGIIAGIKGFTNSGVYTDINDDDYNIFADSPEETLQYLTCHDGFTLWDKINLSYDGSTVERANLVKQSAAMLFTSQGKVLIQAGSEAGRTKPLSPVDPELDRAHTSSLWNEDIDLPGVDHFHENSYRSSDYTNMFRWNRLDQGPFNDIHDYFKGLIKLRRAIPALRYSSSTMINEGLRFIGDIEQDFSYPDPIYSSFEEISELTVNFINGPANKTFYFAGEIHAGDQNPPVNNFSITFDSEGSGKIFFTNEQIRAFDLDKWGATKSLNFKLVTTPGSWDSIPDAYTNMGNTRIKPTVVLEGFQVTVDLSIKDHEPGQIERKYQPFIAYELDNKLEEDGSKTPFEKLIVIHNSSTESATIESDLILDSQNWVVLVDKDMAGTTPIENSTVNIQKGKVIVPPQSSAVIAK